MINFEAVTEETFYIAKEMINSNHDYNVLENGSPTRTDEEIRQEFYNENTHSLFIKADDTYIGIIDYMDKNPKDQTTWIGLFLIHNDYHGYGYGTMAYLALEELFIQKNIPKLRLGVLKENNDAKRFWERHGYIFYKTAKVNKNSVDCYEKVL
ncbi:MAG: GNAT family N-acetyltransferase [Bacillus sp. (in: firmicutes)]